MELDQWNWAIGTGPVEPDKQYQNQQNWTNGTEPVELVALVRLHWSSKTRPAQVDQFNWLDTTRPEQSGYKNIQFQSVPARRSQVHVESSTMATGLENVQHFVHLVCCTGFLLTSSDFPVVNCHVLEVFPAQILVCMEKHNQHSPKAA